MRKLWRALRRDESGQDLLEYALLAATIGIAGALIFPSIVNKLSDNYADANTEIQADWQPCDPGGCAP
jgi:Flp pilus assembly pilin Flp